MNYFILAVLLVVLGVVSAAIYQTPPPTFEAKQFTTWHKKGINKSRRADININFTAEDGSDDYVNLIRLDLVGNAYERGYAQGYLLHKEIIEFTGPKLNKYFVQMVMDIDISSLPAILQPIVRAIQLKGAAHAPELFNTLMEMVWANEEQYTPQALKDEIKGIAQGICDATKFDCDVAQWEAKIQSFNMLPELIRMACTTFGAWGDATAEGVNLLHLRALDFGAGPFSNFTVIATHRDAEKDNFFTSVTFPSFVGAVTGVSQSGVGISEKVWMTYDTPSLQPGSYDGVSDVFVLRNILENAKTRKDAIDYVNSIPRTWAIWMGVGDYESQGFDLIAYKQDSVQVFDDETAPSMTGQPYIPHVAYVDKHPQPTHDGPNGTLPTALQDFYGRIDCETTKSIVQYHQTGDTHYASYDYNNNLMYVAIGKINKHGEYKPEDGSDGNVWKAYNRPAVKFDLNDLWKGI